MAGDFQGELVPTGGGDPIPLRRGVLTLGRRETCDISLRFPNISGSHCELSYKDAGYWYIRDLGSTNGIKVNGQRVLQRARALPLLAGLGAAERGPQQRVDGAHVVHQARLAVAVADVAAVEGGAAAAHALAVAVHQARARAVHRGIGVEARSVVDGR